MYSAFRLAQKFIHYFVTASNGKGHGVHSPFVFSFITQIIKDKSVYPDYKPIEAQRNLLLQNTELLNIEDFGAGSVTKSKNVRSVKNIASSSLKPAKYSQLLYRMVKQFNPKTIIELGTSLGITTSYLASANKKAIIQTLEGSSEIAGVAQQNFTQLQLTNVELTVGNFDDTLPDILHTMPHVEFAFVDGNHRKEPTLRYFNQLLGKHTDTSVFIFDDIHWSKEMEEAWAEIISHPAVTLSIDLFFIGMVFFRKENKVKQHFTIRY